MSISFKVYLPQVNWTDYSTKGLHYLPKCVPSWVVKTLIYTTLQIVRCSLGKIFFLWSISLLRAAISLLGYSYIDIDCIIISCINFVIRLQLGVNYIIPTKLPSTFLLRPSASSKTSIAASLPSSVVALDVKNDVSFEDVNLDVSTWTDISLVTSRCWRSTPWESVARTLALT